MTQLEKDVIKYHYESLLYRGIAKCLLKKYGRGLSDEELDNIKRKARKVINSIY